MYFLDISNFKHSVVCSSYAKLKFLYSIFSRQIREIVLFVIRNDFKAEIRPVRKTLVVIPGIYVCILPSVRSVLCRPFASS